MDVILHRSGQWFTFKAPILKLLGSINEVIVINRSIIGEWHRKCEWKWSVLPACKHVSSLWGWWVSSRGISMSSSGSSWMTNCTKNNINATCSAQSAQFPTMWRGIPFFFVLQSRHFTGMRKGKGKKTTLPPRPNPLKIAAAASSMSSSLSQGRATNEST